MQLEPVAYSPNLLLNSSFEDNPSGYVLPENWDTRQLIPGNGDGLDPSNGDNSLPSLLVNGNGAAKSFSQTVNAPQYAIGGFVLSGSSKQSGATANYTVTATVTYTDNTGSSGSLTFSNTASGWQSQTAPVPITSGKTIQSVTVTGDFSNESGQAWFNDIQLRALPQASSFSAYNFAQNPDFTFNYLSGTLPDDWTDLKTGTGTPSWSQTESYQDANSLQIHPGTSGQAEEVANDGLAPYQSYAHYTAAGYIHTEGLASDSAYIALQALDSSGNVLTTYPSGKVGHSQADGQGNVPWKHVMVDVPASQLPTGTANLRVVLCQDADTNGGSGSGNSYFDDIRLSSWDLNTHYTYDSLGNYATSATDPNGNTTTFTPNTNTGFDTSVTDALGKQTTYTSNKFDETTGTTLPTGAAFAYGYDANGNLTGVADPNGHAVQYAYNSLGQVAQYTETVGGTAEVTGFHHNGNGQMTAIDYPNTTSATFGYNAAGQLDSVSYYNASVLADQWGFAFDGVGNLTQMQEDTASSPTTYGYDANNNLTSVSEPASVTHGGTTYNCTYDGLGRRVTVSGGTINYTYHYNGTSDQIAYITDANNNLVARFSYGANGLPAYMTMVSGGSTYVYRYIYDGQGDIIGLVDVTAGSATVGHEVVTYGYDAWGNEIPSLTTDSSGTNASTINPFTYRGHAYDSQTGLYYHGIWG